MVLSRSRDPQSNVTRNSVPFISISTFHPILHVTRVTSAIGMMIPVSGKAIMLVRMNCVGNVIIIGLAMNMLGISKFKVMNLVPAIFLPIVLCPLFG